MRTTVIQVPTDEIVDWATFHTVFKRVLGFPSYYGRNMNAWIDCLTYVDDEDSGMTDPFIMPGDLMTLQLKDVADFKERCPEQYDALIECTAFVNYRRVETGGNPVLTLMLEGWFQ